MKTLIKKIISILIGEDYVEYGKIWYQIHIEAKYLPLDDSFWDRPLFVHIPKTAGNSIHETVEVSSVMGHKSIQYYQHKLPDGKEMPFSFTVVRNPMERFCSSFYYLKQGGNSLYDKIWADKHLSSYNDINDFAANGLKKQKISSWHHFLPQIHFITDKDGNTAVDFIIRFENLNEDWRRLAERLNFTEQLPIKNSKGGGAQTSKLNDTSRNIIYTFYKEDFLQLGYKNSLNSTREGR